MDTIKHVQKAISELHRVMDTVKEYLDKRMEGVAMPEIDYTNPDQEFYLRIFTEFEQMAKTISYGMDYVDRPVRKQGELMFDYSEGKYKLVDEHIEDGKLFELLINGQWQIVVLKKGELHSVIKGNPIAAALQGMKARVR